MVEKLNNLVDLAASLSPKEIVAELDRFVIGQKDAKKAVAIALRNRYRRKAVEESLREEIVPKNILMVGPTGVGKTEIARRLAKLSNAPFLKVEATKFTEIGYVGRDVDSIVRDITEISIKMVKDKKRKANLQKAEEKVRERIIEALVGKKSSPETKDKFTKMLDAGKLDDREIEIEVQDKKTNNNFVDIPGMPGSQMGMINIGDMLGKALNSNKLKAKKMLVKDAYSILLDDELDKLIDDEKIALEAIKLVENEGIIFIDEIDKIASSESRKSSNVNREGVQRDLLPIIEGSTVATKYGTVKTDHMLFIASGAFYMSKPSDLLPELQGRLPIRVELNDLTKEDIISIIQEPENSLLKQYVALIGTENVELKFTKDGIDKIADISITANKEVENIGARRLHTIFEKLLEDISFNAPEMKGKKKNINAKYVEEKLGRVVQKSDLSKFIL